MTCTAPISQWKCGIWIKRDWGLSRKRWNFQALYHPRLRTPIGMLFI